MPRYPSDLSDAQRAVLEPEARAAMAGLVRVSGRPMVHDLRRVDFRRATTRVVKLR